MDAFWHPFLGKKMKKTKIFELSKQLNKEMLLEAAEMLANGGTVVFPTETVYGLGANALSSDAVLGIFEAKGRPSDNPLIVHISEREMLNDLVSEVSLIAEQLMDAFWPGALTIIFPKSSKVPQEVTGGLNTVGVRMPSHAIAKELIHLSGVPVAAPSANISTKPSPTMGKHVVNDMSSRVDGIIVGDDSDIGVESTVVTIKNDVVTILRPGGVTIEALKEVVGHVAIDPNLLGVDKNVTPMSPGMKYRHYSPDGELYLYVDSNTSLLENALASDYHHFSQKGLRVGVIASDEFAKTHEAMNVLSYGSRKDLLVIQKQIFNLLRECDIQKYEIILVEGVNEFSEGNAIMNRLKKAAKYIVK